MPTVEIGIRLVTKKSELRILKLGTTSVTDILIDSGLSIEVGTEIVVGKIEPKLFDDVTYKVRRLIRNKEQERQLHYVLNSALIKAIENPMVLLGHAIGRIKANRLRDPRKKLDPEETKLIETAEIVIKLLGD